jgi:hypothetical protein|tara:strand:+ start:2302 stop:2793 length:492 start_codon:yes stop_codon:yes gene_type:complete
MGMFAAFGKKVHDASATFGKKMRHSVQRGVKAVSKEAGSIAKTAGDIADVAGTVGSVSATLGAGAAMVGLEPVAAGLLGVAAVAKGVEAGARGVSSVASTVRGGTMALEDATSTIDAIRKGDAMGALKTAERGVASAQGAIKGAKGIGAGVQAGKKTIERRRK